MTKLTVVSSQHTDSWEESDEPYSSYEINHYVYPHSLKIVKSDAYDILTPFDVGVGDCLFVVYVEYSTGDSFGTTSGNIEYIGGYKDMKTAEECIEIIKNDYESHGEDFTTLDLPLGDGRTFKYYTGTYKGYFDLLEIVDMCTLKVL